MITDETGLGKMSKFFVGAGFRGGPCNFVAVVVPAAAVAAAAAAAAEAAAAAAAEAPEAVVTAAEAAEAVVVVVAVAFETLFAVAALLEGQGFGRILKRVASLGCYGW